MTVGRNDSCPRGNGKKFKKCCAAKGEAKTAGLAAAIRMKGGVSFDPASNAYRAIVHSWDNAGNSRIASPLIAGDDSNIIIAGHARFRGCA